MLRKLKMKAYLMLVAVALLVGCTQVQQADTGVTSTANTPTADTAVSPPRTGVSEVDDVVTGSNSINSLEEEFDDSSLDQVTADLDDLDW